MDLILSLVIGGLILSKFFGRLHEKRALNSHLKERKGRPMMAVKPCKMINIPNPSLGRGIRIDSRMVMDLLHGVERNAPSRTREIDDISIYTADSSSDEAAEREQFSDSSIYSSDNSTYAAEADRSALEDAIINEAPATDTLEDDTVWG
ncbi:hypothetical protein FSP39_002897 [Pinctada imbricata]|uniref:Uncharacterized protein n=1 Tax=Pinctada imbricata TaxID=66713 RepID=A0AA89CBF5_PINIB|nr:hypothetical protein FSP39_002897 [Pinctada imbricata]